MSANHEERDRIVAARSEPRHGGFGFVDFPDLPEVDGLISPGEQRYLYWLTSSMFAGEGAVVELGSWFGRSAIALGAGLRDAGLSVPLHCFDRFYWREQFAGTVSIADVQLPDGGDFMPYFLANVEPVYPQVVATKADVTDIEWSGGPIELLFVDAPKSFEDLGDALLTFGAALRPRRSLLILQDFFYAPAYPIALTVAMMAADLQLVHTVAGSSTAAFVVERHLPSAIVPTSWKYWTFPDEVVEAQFAALVAAVPEEQRSLLQPALGFYHLDRGKPGRARHAMAHIDFSPLGRQRIEFYRANPALRGRVEALLGE